MTDDLGNCPYKVKGSVKVSARWIPTGQPDSKFDAATGLKREDARVASKQEQLIGTSGKLEIYPLQYIHPYKLDVTQKYFVEMCIEGGDNVI